MFKFSTGYGSFFNCIMVLQTGKSDTIRESIQTSGVLKAHYV